MSKKNRQRGITATRSASFEEAAEDFLTGLLRELWDALAEGDPLSAEVATARFLAMAGLGEDGEDRPAEILLRMAMQSREPEDAALLRIIALLSSPAAKRDAGRALAELTEDGVYPAEWVTEVGKATPRQAWRHHDVFGDAEQITVTYAYTGGEHAVVADIDLTTFSFLADISLVTETATLADDIAAAAGSSGRHEAIDLTDARRRIEQALLRSGHAPELPVKANMYLPILRSRVRRLPAPAAEDSGPAFTAADRAAAVGAFMASPQAAEVAAADEASTRFWAQVLTGYSSRTQGEPPAQVGPLKLEAILHGFVPETFTLTEAQRRHVRPAVTAWTNWSAAYRELGDDDTERLTHDLPAMLDTFDRWYDNPFATEVRAYVADLATGDADVAMLDDVAFRRMIAVPVPGERDRGELTDKLDASTPDDRRAYAAEEFAECELRTGYTRELLVAEAQRVIEELWRGDPPATWERAQRLLGEGVDRHDVIHQLMRQK